MEAGVLLRSERLSLRACSREELLSIYRGDTSFIEHAESWPSREFVESLPHFINDMMEDPANYGWNVYLIMDRSGRVVGDCGFKGPPSSSGEVEIAFSIVGSERRKGYAGEAVKMLVDRAFAREDVSSLIAECSEENIASRRLLMKLGFTVIWSGNGVLIHSVSKNNLAARTAPR